MTDDDANVNECRGFVYRGMPLYLYLIILGVIKADLTIVLIFC